MKAIVKFTGDEVDVTRGETIDGITYYYHRLADGHTVKFPENRLEFPQLTVTTPPIDWEQRRYEIAKEAIIAIMANEEFFDQVLDEGAQSGERIIPVNISHAAVAFADALVAELKKGGEE